MAASGVSVSFDVRPKSMRSLPPDTPEAAALRTWLEATVLADYGFRPELIGEPMLLFERDFRGSLIMAMLDGLPEQRPDWAGSQRPSDLLFRALGTFLNEVPSHVAQVLGHDGAWWEVRSVYRVPVDKRYVPYALTLLHLDPADESGPTYLMLIADDLQSAIVLADKPYLIPPYSAHFCIVFHGNTDRRAVFLNHLQNAASTGASIPL